MSRMLMCHALDDTDHADQAVLHQLCQKLQTAGHEVLLASGNTSQAAFLAFLHDELPSCHWFVLFQTPSSARSPLIRTAVARALDLVEHQQIGGILRFIAQDSAPQDLPPTWSTIPPFDAGNDFLLDQNYLPLYLRTPLAAPNTPVLAAVPPLAPSEGSAPYPGDTSAAPAMPGTDAPPLSFTGGKRANSPSEEPRDFYSYTPVNRLSSALRDPAETYTPPSHPSRLPRFLLIGGAIVAGMVLFSGLFLNLGLLQRANKHAAHLSKPISTTTIMPFSPTPVATRAATSTTVPIATATTGAVAPTTPAMPTPYPSALRNHPFAKAWSPTDLYNWGPGSNAPGNCSTPNTSEITNLGSYVQLSTSGATGDC